MIHQVFRNPHTSCGNCPLEHSQARERMAAQRYLVFDRLGRLIWISPSWSELGKPAELCGHRWLEFVSSDHLAAVRVWLQCADLRQVRFGFLPPHQVETQWMTVGLHRHRWNRCCWIVVGDLDDQVRP